MAVPGMPFAVLCGLVVAGQLIAAPFAAARAAILPHVLTGERYVVASAVSGTTYQSGQVLGFALGGPLVALVGVPVALLADAATFVVSALILQVGVAEQRATGGVPDDAGVRLRDGARIVVGDRRLRSLVALACVSAFVVTVEGLAAPYAASLGGGPVTVGLLLAANPLGAALGIVLLARLVPPARRDGLLGPLAVLSCVPLVASALDPPLGGVIALWVVSGLACAYQVPANAAFVAAVPDAHRGQAFGLAVTALRVTQGLGVLVAGLLAERTGPATAVALAGAARRRRGRGVRRRLEPRPRVVIGPGRDDWLVSLAWRAIPASNTAPGSGPSASWSPRSASSSPGASSSRRSASWSRGASSSRRSASWSRGASSSRPRGFPSDSLGVGRTGRARRHGRGPSHTLCGGPSRDVGATTDSSPR